MADLKEYKVYKNTQFEILTDEGFKDFKGLIVGKNPNKVILGIDNKIKLVCTPKHKLMLNLDTHVYAKDLHVNDKLHDNHKITSIEFIENNDPVYEILHVSDNHRYYVNGILSKQCLIIDEMAFIPDHIMSEFWKSVIPVISSYMGTKVFAVSTPNGTGNKFHEIYTGAEAGKLKQWNHERIDWWEIPGRGKKWKEAMIELLAKEDKSFDQEFGNVFIETGQSAVDADLLNYYRSIARKPKILLEDGAYKIWETPDPDHLYVVGVDVGEGIGQAASVAQVLDMTDLTSIKLVATYHNNLIDPFHFAEVLYKMTNQWGQPFLLIERNNCGGQVIDALRQVHNYHNLVDYTPTKQKYYDRMGIYSHTNSKYKGVINMRYWVNSLRVVDVYDIALVQELETFVRYPNGTWKAKAGDYIYDDRVLSLVWGLFALETAVAEKYFDVHGLDDRGKPLKIEAVSVPDSKYFKIDEVYREAGAPLPSHVGGNMMNMDPDGIEALQMQGWELMK